MLIFGIILLCLFIIILINQVSTKDKSVVNREPMTKELYNDEDEEFQSPQDVGLLDLNIQDHMLLKVEYETVDTFYHKDNKYAVLCQIMGDKYTNSISVLPLKTPLDENSLIIKDKEVFIKASKLFKQFKSNNKERFINWG